MSKNTKHATLEEIKAMRSRGETHQGTPVAQVDTLPDDFWETAVLVAPAEKKSVHLKLDPEVFAFFKNGGKGHITRMQAVLAAYVQAHRQ